MPTKAFEYEFYCPKFGTIKIRLLLSELDRRSQSKDISSAAKIKQLVEKNPELQSALKEFASEVKVEYQRS